MKKSKKIKRLNLKSSFATCAITIFPEHLPEGEAALYAKIRSISSLELQIVAICHSKSKGKLHYHILIRVTNGKKRKRVSTMLKMLGIEFRPDVDKKFLSNRALETCGSFVAYTTYLLHKTTEAVQDGKAPYDKNDIVTNLTADELQMLLDGYSVTKRSLSKRAIPHITDAMRDAGYNLASYDKTLASFNVLGLTDRQESAFKKAYAAGVNERAQTDSRIDRICIEFEYPEDMTYELKYKIDNAFRAAFEGYRVASAEAKNKLMLDILTDVVLLFDNNEYYEIQSLSMDYIAEISKDYAVKKALWAGRYFVVTHPTRTEKRDGRITHLYSTSNAFFCDLVDNKLHFKTKPQLNFINGEQVTEEVKRIRDEFNKYMAQDTPKGYEIDLDDLNS